MRLTYTDLLTIEKLYNKGYKQNEIAKIIGCTPACICYEIKRGAYLHKNSDLTESVCYSADISWKKREYNKTSHGVDVKLTWEMAEYYADAINNKKYSVRVAVGRAKMENKPTVSYTTLYRYIKENYIPNLQMKFPKRKQKYRQVAKRATVGVSIEKRPKHINNRQEFGHFEMDSVIGKKEGVGESIIVLTERKTRYEMIVKVKAKTSAETIKALSALRSEYGDIFKTITVDNGTEFSDYQGIKKNTGEVYYCHPYSSYERGSNENCNRIIRRYIPKGTSMKSYTNENIRKIQDTINNMPRQILGYKTARECFDEEIKKLNEKIKFNA